MPNINEIINHNLHREYIPYADFTSVSLNGIDDIKNNLDKITKLNKESLFFRVGNLELNQDLSDFIKKMQSQGLQELVMFFDNKNINQNNFKDFLQQNKISLPITLIPTPNTSQFSLSNLKQTSTYEFRYNGTKVNSLNNAETSKIILENYQESLAANSLANSQNSSLSYETAETTDGYRPIKDSSGISSETEQEQEQEQD